MLAGGSRALAGVAAAALILCACASQGEEETVAEPPSADRLQARAAELARDLVIVDTHIDVPYRLTEDPDLDISQPTDGGDFDHPRALEGGLDVAFMSVYVPADYQESGGARAFADELIDMVEGFASEWPEKFHLVTSADGAARQIAGSVGLAMGMENGEPIEGDLANLRHFYDRGIRYITLTHSKNNHICDSSYATDKQWNGLSPFGREVVTEMNRLGMMIDVSHLSDAATEQVLELSTQPVIASHSSARRFTPGFERNMSDDLIEKLAANGGVLQINFGSAFLTEAANRVAMATWAALEQFAQESGLDPDHPEVETWTETYRQENPLPLANVADVVDHIEHVVETAGIDHVGVGSDFDGVGPTLPRGLEDVSRFPNLIAALLERGYSEEDVEKILGGNLLRVWRAVEAAAG